VLAILYTLSAVVATVLIIPMCILFVFVLILQMRNISSAKKEEDVDYCLKTYFIYKYITMPVELIFLGIVGAFSFVIIEMIIPNHFLPFDYSPFKFRIYGKKSSL